MPGRDTDGKWRWAGAAFGGDDAEAEKRGGETDLREVWIHCGAGLGGWQKAVDGLAWLGESARGVFANVRTTLKMPETDGR